MLDVCAMAIIFEAKTKRLRFFCLCGSMSQHFFCCRRYCLHAGDCIIIMTMDDG